MRNEWSLLDRRKEEKMRREKVHVHVWAI
jgi:hypothetical protein